MRNCAKQARRAGGASVTRLSGLTFSAQVDEAGMSSCARTRPMNLHCAKHGRAANSARNGAMTTRMWILCIVLPLACLMGTSLSLLLIPVSTGPSLDMPTTCEIGEIEHEEIRNVSLRFHNVGGGTLRIYDVIASCTCVVGALDKDTYEPGDAGEIRLQYQGMGFPGTKIEQVVVVRSNDPRLPIRKVIMRGAMAAALRPSPSTLIVGGLAPGQGWNRELVVRWIGEEEKGKRPFEIRSVASDLHGIEFTTTALENEVLGALQPAGSGYSILVRQPIAGPIGNHIGRIWIATSSDRFPRLEVPLLVEVLSAFKATPEFLLFEIGGKTSPGATCGQTLTIEAPQLVEFRFSSGDERIECRSDTVGPASKWCFQCWCRYSGQSRVDGRLEFRVSGYPAESRISVPYAVVRAGT